MFRNLTRRFLGGHEVPAILTKPEITNRLNRRDLIVEPLLHEVAACSVDLRLDNYFGIFTSSGEGALDPGRASRAIRFEEIPFFSAPFYVQTGTFVLAQTLEFIGLPPDIVGHLDGRSSLARRGLVVHTTAGWIDPGWEGHVTLELANLGAMPIALYPGMKIGRIVFEKVTTCERYSGQFKGQLRIREPKVDEECAQIAAYASKLREPS